MNCIIILNGPKERSFFFFFLRGPKERSLELFNATAIFNDTYMIFVTKFIFTSNLISKLDLKLVNRYFNKDLKSNKIHCIIDLIKHVSNLAN